MENLNTASTEEIITRINLMLSPGSLLTQQVTDGLSGTALADLEKLQRTTLLEILHLLEWKHDSAVNFINMAGGSFPSANV